jgi:hypothetical protein
MLTRTWCGHDPIAQERKEIPVSTAQRVRNVYAAEILPWR